MKKLAVVLMMLAVVALLAPAAFAQDAGAKGGSGHTGLLAIAAGLGMGLAAFGGAFGQGRVAAAACEGMARNPAARPGIQLALILGLAFIESLVLFTLVIIFVKVA